MLVSTVQVVARDGWVGKGMSGGEPEFLNFEEAQESIPKNQIPPGCVLCGAGRTNLFLLGSQPQ